MDQVYKHVPVIPFDSGTKLVVMSDCHRGQGNAGDNFLANQAVCFGALEYYFQKGFTYVELGDGDELWENRKLKTIVEVHDDIFWMMSRFYEEKRLYMVYGNHDIVKRNKSYAKALRMLLLRCCPSGAVSLSGYLCPGGADFPKQKRWKRNFYGTRTSG